MWQPTEDAKRRAAYDRLAAKGSTTKRNRSLKRDRSRSPKRTSTPNRKRDRSRSREKKSSHFSSSSSSSSSSSTNSGLYVLLLHHNKRYVGESENIDQRFKVHESGAGSEWTRKYPPIKIESRHTKDNPFAEDILVKKLMLEHGVHNVRGGSYSQLVLPDAQHEALHKEFATATNACFTCGERGHYARYCKSLIDYDEEGAKCSRCGRDYHVACWAKTDVNGRTLKK